MLTSETLTNGDEMKRLAVLERERMLPAKG
jgi:hypothetical protein